jgi:hypothetical protein
MGCKLAAALPLAALLGLLAAPARAGVDAWEFEVYPAQTAGKGMLEVESLNSFVASGHSKPDEGAGSEKYESQHMFRTSLELAYGITDRIEAAAYLNLAKPVDGPFQYAGSKYRLRGSLFDQGQLPVDLGWYAELEWNRTPRWDDQDLELELRPILSKDLGRFSLAVNPQFEKVLVGSESSEGFEFKYSAALDYRWQRWLSPGLEVYGDIGLIDDVDSHRDQQHYVFPCLRGALPGGLGLEWNLGVGFGLTPNSDDVITKLNIELERFVGPVW